MQEERIRRKKPKLKFNIRMQKKLAVSFGIIVLALFALCIRIAYLNYEKGNTYSMKVLSQQGYTSKTIPYKRGDILDRNGTVLATSVKVYNLIVDSKIILSNDKYMQPTIDALTKYFDLKENELKKEIRKRKNSSYWVVLKKLQYKDIEDFQSYLSGNEVKTDKEKAELRNVQGIWFEEEYERMYPYNKLGCSVLGFVNRDGSATVGIENSYSDYLAGTDGREYGYVNADNNMETVIKDPTDGYTVVSTIDMNIQRIVQKAITKYMDKYKPKMLAVVIADPNTGEILAMSDNITYDLNEPWNLEDFYSKSKIEKMNEKDISDNLNKIWKNFCVSDSFEPGSTAKPFTIAAAYEEGTVSQSSSYVCDGHQTIGGYTISCHKQKGHGTISLKEALAFSCNDAMMQLGMKLGASEFTEYQRRFGFGAKTGIDLPSETRGIMYDETMGESSLATNSFGQNFTVNMIQMVAGFSSLINGGYYYEPHVAKEVITEDGNLVENYSKTLIKQTVTSSTSEFIKESCRAVVTDGTGTNAAIEGYTVGGKTGTAEKHYNSEGKTGIIKGEYIVSFLGCVPCENPEVVCYTIMDSPKDQTDSTAYSTEFWAYIMKQVLPYMGISQTVDENKDEDVQKKSADDADENYPNGIIFEDNDPGNN